VDVPMFEGMLSVVLGEHLAGHQFVPPRGKAGYQRSLAHDRRPYATSDGHICVLVYNDKHWRSFFDAIGRPEIFREDVRFQSQNQRLENIDHVYGFLSDIIRTRSTAEWLALFEQADLPAARMYSVADILEDEHVLATGFVQIVTHPTQGDLRVTAIPTEWSDSVPENRCPAPEVGENTGEVLAEFGYSEHDLARLRASGAVGRGSRN
jgi:crotonobetainyl-CoA:carnitine CoA-transferase CaiB-like acyl-CoA transferase